MCKKIFSDRVYIPLEIGGGVAYIKPSVLFGIFGLGDIPNNVRVCKDGNKLGMGKTRVILRKYFNFYHNSHMKNTYRES